MPGPNFLGAQSSKDEKEKQGKGKRASVDKVGLNLITQDTLDRMFQRIERKDITQLIVSFAISVILGSAAWGAVYLYGGKAREAIQDVRIARAAVEEQIMSIEKNKTALLAYQTKLTAFNNLFKNHLYWTQFFEELEKHTLPNVAYDSISISTNYVTSLSAHTTDYASVAKQLIAFQDASSFVTNVEITSANAVLSPTGVSTGVNFSVRLEIDPAVITKTYAAD
ncbi:hypothetical protein HYW94_01740 [Candidatus Uhrbacteria bacterium]|nr:hypothetical protein [Candidatus Uhrbacteria bacterium]